MFEPITFDVLMKEMLAETPNDMDKREGSILWNALAPAAVELQNAYIQLDMILNQTFADTAEEEYLSRRCSERGIYRYPASKALLKGEFSINEIPIGSRFSLEAYNYIAREKLADGIYKMECEAYGSEGNSYFGDLIPIEYIKGLTWARLTELLIPGEDRENDAALRKRYFDSLKSQAYGGNIEDYKQKVNAIQGVGGVKVYPVWNGGGTVKLVLIASDFSIPTAELVNEVQTAIDPVQNKGKGMGIAPIGHVVTVAGVKAERVTIESQMTYTDGWAFLDVLPYVEEIIDRYFQELAQKWEESETTIVRISQLESRLLEIQGIMDIANTKLDGVAANLILDSDSIPVRGDVLEFEG